MAEQLLVIDEGTSSTRAALYGRDGGNVSRAHGEFSQVPVALSSPRPEVVEQDGIAIWQHSLAMAQKAANGQKPSGIAITNQRETTLLWDKATGVPVLPAYVWQDRRGAEFGELLKGNGGEAELTAQTGLLADPYFSAFKLRHIFQTHPDILARAKNGDLRFGTVDCWLIDRLTDGKSHCTDPSNGSRTGLFNIHTGNWSESLLEMFDIPEAILPKIIDSDGDFGTTSLFGGQVKICGVLGDQQAALLGQSCVKAGQAKITFGTGAFLMAHTGQEAKKSQSRLLTTVAMGHQGQLYYALEGAVLNAGTSIQWLRDEMGLFAHAADTEAMAKSVADNGGVTFVPAFTGLGAPHWQANARGLIAGLGRGSSAGHLVRAALEASAFQTADLLDALKNDGVASLAGLYVDGGMVANGVFLSALADICGLNIIVPEDGEMTAKGAAMIGAMGLGWTDLDQIAENGAQQSKTIAPQMADGARTLARAKWARAVAASISIGAQ